MQDLAVAPVYYILVFIETLCSIVRRSKNKYIIILSLSFLITLATHVTLSEDNIYSIYHNNATTTTTHYNRLTPEINGVI